MEKEKCNLSKWVLCSHFFKKLLTKFKLSRSKSPRDAILFSQHMSLLMEPLLGRQSQPQEELGASSAFSSMATRSAFQLCRVPTHAVHMRMLVPRPVAVVQGSFTYLTSQDSCLSLFSTIPTGPSVSSRLVWQGSLGFNVTGCSMCLGFYWTHQETCFQNWKWEVKLHLRGRENFELAENMTSTLMAPTMGGNFIYLWTRVYWQQLSSILTSARYLC